MEGSLLRDLEGRPLREVLDRGGRLTWLRDYVWGPAGLLAVVDPEHGTRRVVTDHLGTPRLVCDRCAERVAYHELWPYGEDAPGSTDDGLRIRFTGHERDLNLPTKTTDDLDYMHARYYSFWTGRFLSVDPAEASWSRYAYVSGNPINATDPDGRAENLLLGDKDLPVNLGSVETVETAWDAFFTSTPLTPFVSRSARSSRVYVVAVQQVGGRVVVMVLDAGVVSGPTPVHGTIVSVGGRLVLGRRVVEAAWGGHGDMRAAAGVLGSGGALLSTFRYVGEGVGAVQEELAIAGHLASLGAEVEVPTGFMYSGLTGGTALLVGGATYVASASLGRAIRVYVIPESWNRAMGDAIYAALRVTPISDRVWEKLGNFVCPPLVCGR